MKIDDTKPFIESLSALYNAGVAAEKKRILILIGSLGRYEDVEDGVTATEYGWLVGFEDVIAVVNGDEA